MKQCETCKYREGDFQNDKEDANVIRAYCKARHVLVDALLMSANGCDFWSLHSNYENPQKEEIRYGL